MRRWEAVLTVTGMTLLGLVMSAVPARSVVPGRNGRIVFARETCRPTCMYTIIAADANDTNETLLPGPDSRDAYDDSFIANWWPDGKTVILMSARGGGQASRQVSGDAT